MSRFDEIMAELRAITWPPPPHAHHWTTLGIERLPIEDPRRMALWRETMTRIASFDQSHVLPRWFDPPAPRKRPFVVQVCSTCGETRWLEIPDHTPATTVRLGAES